MRYGFPACTLCVHFQVGTALDLNAEITDLQGVKAAQIPMTKINPKSPTIRESAALHKNRAIIVEMQSSCLIFRVKGMRSVR